MVKNQKEKQKETEQMMYGAWQITEDWDENTVFDYALQIDEKETHFEVKKNGETVTDERFATTGLHWMTGYFTQTDPLSSLVTDPSFSFPFFG